jgi:hypothetical protein
VHRETKELVRVVKTTKDHKSLGDLKGTITARPFDIIQGDVTQFTLRNHKRDDLTIMEMDYVYVRPSDIVTVTGSLSRAAGLCIAVDVTWYMNFALLVEKESSNGPLQLYQDPPNTNGLPTSLVPCCGA